MSPTVCACGVSVAVSTLIFNLISITLAILTSLVAIAISRHDSVPVRTEWGMLCPQGSEQ